MKPAWIVALVGLAACAATGHGGGADAGCAAWAEARGQMPRPVGTGPLAEWVAATDGRMTGACR